MGSQLKLNYDVGQLTHNNLQDKQGYSNWLVKSMMAENQNNILIAFELPKNQKKELIEKINELVINHINQK